MKQIILDGIGFEFDEQILKQYGWSALLNLAIREGKGESALRLPAMKSISDFLDRIPYVYDLKDGQFYQKGVYELCQQIKKST